MEFLAFFDQTFQASDLAIIGLLVVLEGSLSVDNALVLGLLAKRLPPHLRQRALTYGLVGAFVFRFAAIAVAVWLLEYPIVKLLGGGYLLFIAFKHFFLDRHDKEKDSIKLGPDGHPIVDEATGTPPVIGASVVKYAKFWPTVFVIEMTDIAFAVDSIVAATALVADHKGEGRNPKLWVVILGGFFGVVLMRFAALIFIRLLERFPRFEIAAYLLVTVIGLKLCVDYIGNLVFATEAHPHPVNFHDTASPWFWGFWILMLTCFAYGFMRRKPVIEGDHNLPT